MTYPRMPKRPAQNRRQRFWWSLAIAAILLLLILPSIAHFFTEWYWFKELGRTDAYWTLTWGPWLLGGMIGLLFFLFVFGNIVIAMRLIPETSWRDFRDRLADQAIDLLVRSLRRLTIGVGALVSLLMAMSVGHTAATHWQTVLLFFHAQSTGVTDPVFQRDISFYFFRLPVWELLARWGFFTLVCTLVLVVAIYLLTRVLHSIRRSRNNFFAGMLWHLSILLSLALLCKAILYMLGRYGLLTQVRGDFVGPFYTEMHASMPGLMILAVLLAYPTF